MNEIVDHRLEEITYRGVALILSRSLPLTRAFCVPCTRISDRSAYTSRNLVALGLRHGLDPASEYVFCYIFHLPHFTFLCLHNSHLKHVQPFIYQARIV